MIWPFTELRTLRLETLDQHRQIASLTTRLEILAQTLTAENTRLQSHLSQYIDDLRHIANLKTADLSGPASPPEDDIIMTPMLRAKVNELNAQFKEKAPHLDVLDLAKGFYQRSAELQEETNNATISQETSSD